MPIETKQYKIEVEVDWIKLCGAKPNWTWDACVFEFKTSNIVFSEKECADMQSYLAGMVAKHTDQFSGIRLTVIEKSIETEEEYETKQIEKLSQEIAELQHDVRSGLEIDLDALDKKREQLAKLTEKWPNVIIAAPQLPIDLKCEDEEA